MVIDFRVDSGHARAYDVVEAATGERIARPIFFADEQAGVYRYYDMEPTGRHGVKKIKGEIEVRADIRIVLRTGRAS